MSFIEREINVTIELVKGTFGDGGHDTIKVSGLRVVAMIEKLGAPGFNSAQLRIYGLPLSVMNRVSSLWVPITDFVNNTVTIEAGDAKSGMPVVFVGSIFTAWANLGRQPEASLDIVSRTGLFGSLKPVPPLSFTGSTDVAVIMSGLAAQMELGFENSGVQGIFLSNPYFPGTAMMQAQRCAEAANINLAVDDRTLAIWPKNAVRQGVVPLIAGSTGLQGYPTYNGSGISFRTLYNPNIKFGGRVKVESEVTAASGIWEVWRLIHSLSSQTPGGPWFSDIEGKVPLG